MTSPTSDLLDKIRQQFDTSPYPRVPLDKSPKDDPNLLYIHNLVTPYYLRNQKFIDTKGKVILDAGCGTGYKSLVLAEANPGAKIVGIDISEESIKLAQQRLEYHGFDNAEFHVLPIEELPKLDYQFDYINCDELLYLFPDLAAALQAMISVLKPNGIIRSNLHSPIQRFTYFRAQRVFTMMGLMDENPEDLEMGIVVETMKALKDNVDLKAKTWNSNKYEGENGKERILMNYLFQGDKLKTCNFQEELVACITEFRIFPISNYLSLVEEFVGIDSSLAFCLIPLLEQPQPMKFLVERWKQFRPLDPITFKPTDEEQAFQMVQQLLLMLESLGYVMLERQS